ncbi:MAG: tetratricopeptide repeat protein [Candidatus Omnitrophica bacterium]|nr:tetratricopeptide repeat protein [Candidatus Omnitrophota bacterium]
MSDLPPAAETLKAQAFEQLQGGLLDEAVATFSTCLSLQPEDVSALRGRGVAYLQSKQWPLASADLRAAATLKPDDPENWVDLGFSLGMENQAYQAIEIFERVLAKHPQHVRGHVQLGLLYFRLAAIAKGREQMQAALAAKPSLTERRAIEAVLREQDRLDKQRYYRPDFEALRKDRRGLSLDRIMQTVRRWFGHGDKDS